MMNALELALPAWLLVRLLNARVGFAGGIRHRAGFERSPRLVAPFPSCILVAAMFVSLLIPAACFLLGDAGFARFPIAEAVLASAADLEKKSAQGNVLRKSRMNRQIRSSGDGDATAAPRPSLAMAVRRAGPPESESASAVARRSGGGTPSQVGPIVACAFRARLIGTALTGIWLLGTLAGATRAILRRWALARWSHMFQPCLSHDVCRAARQATGRIGLRGTISVLESDGCPCPRDVRPLSSKNCRPLRSGKPNCLSSRFAPSCGMRWPISRGAICGSVSFRSAHRSFTGGTRSCASQTAA